jgi:hypothetical protein
MKNSMTSAIEPAMIRVMNKRVWLNQAWSG